MEGSYRYNPLSLTRSIRILRLHAANKVDAPISCDLEEVSLDESPSYGAVSYAWDGQERSVSVSCAGQRLSTTPNCAAFLREYREPYKVMTVWADSLCIDQSSVTERNQQVTLMGEVYKGAQRVYVWLGEGDAQTERAINTLRDMVDIKHLKLKELASSGVEHPIKVIHDRAEGLKRNAKTEKEDIVGPLFRRSWFSRLWTVQEVSLPNTHSVQVNCGSSGILWDHLMIAVDALRAVKYPWGRYQEAMRTQKYLCKMVGAQRNPAMRAILITNAGDTVRKPYVSHILTFARKKASTDPKDKVFALLGLLKELGFRCITPDYRKSLEDIYREAAVMAITDDQDLSMLFQAPSDKRHPGLASWAPDWSDPGWEESEMRTALTRDRFCAAGPSEPVWDFSQDHLSLNLSGKIIDTIKNRTEKLDMKYTDPRVMMNRPCRNEDGSWVVSDALRDINACFQMMKTWVEVSTWYEEYPTGETVKGALKRTLLYDNPELAGRQNSEAEFDAWYSTMLSSDLEHMRHILELQGMPAELLQSEDFLRKCMADIPEEVRTSMVISNHLVSGYHWSAVLYSRFKCLFTTEHGYLGTAPDFVIPGDRIAVIAGLCMPIILRSGDRGYELVTHAYVHGVMYGDAWPEDSSKLESITLV